MKYNPNIPFCSDEFIKETLNRYAGNYQIKKGLSYATVKDYCDSWDNLNPLSKHGDLKNVQRPWALKAILSKVPIGGKILEIGEGEPIVAAILAKMGYEVTFINPYDLSGNGSAEYDKHTKNYPEVGFIRGIFQPFMNELAGEETSFDAVYSYSVIEHLAFQEIQKIFSAMQLYLKPNGVSIHSIDYVHKGNGEKQFRVLIDELSKMSGISTKDVDSVLGEIDNDTDTYFLSPEAHNAWRMGKPYEEFPMRVMVSIQIVTSYSDFLSNTNKFNKNYESGDFALVRNGFCPACDKDTVFRSKNHSYRDYYRCILCNSIPRERAIFNAFNLYFQGWRNSIIHEAAPSNSYFANFVKDYSFSHFYEDLPLGEIVNGNRNENLEKLTFPDNTFDYFVCLDVLEHVFFPDKAISEMVRVIRPGGAVVFAVPVYKDLEKSVQRAKLLPDNTIEYFLPEDYHGNPVGDGKSLVTWNYGQDFKFLIERWYGEGIDVRIYNSTNEELGIIGEFIDIIIISKKQI